MDSRYKTILANGQTSMLGPTDETERETDERKMSGKEPKFLAQAQVVLIAFLSFSKVFSPFSFFFSFFFFPTEKERERERERDEKRKRSTVTEKNLKRESGVLRESERDSGY